MAKYRVTFVQQNVYKVLVEAPNLLVLTKAWEADKQMFVQEADRFQETFNEPKVESVPKEQIIGWVIAE